MSGRAPQPHNRTRPAKHTPKLRERLPTGEELKANAIARRARMEARANGTAD